MFREGQEVFWVKSLTSMRNAAKTGPTVIIKIEDRWLYLENGHRVNMETGEAEYKRGLTPGRCYLSEESYRKEQQTLEAWQKLKKDLQASGLVPMGVTPEDIERARDLLGLGAKSSWTDDSP